MRDEYESDLQAAHQIKLLDLFRQLLPVGERVWLRPPIGRDDPSALAQDVLAAHTQDGSLVAVLGGQSPYPPWHPYPIVPGLGGDLVLELCRLYVHVIGPDSRVIVRGGVVAAVEMTERKWFRAEERIHPFAAMPAVYLTNAETFVRVRQESWARSLQGCPFSLSAQLVLPSDYSSTTYDPGFVTGPVPIESEPTTPDERRRTREFLWRKTWPYVGFFHDGPMPGEISNPRAYAPPR